MKQGDDNALMEVLEKYGPVAVAIDASHYSFTIYHNFIFGSVPNICKSSSIGFVILSGFKTKGAHGFYSFTFFPEILSTYF